MANKISVKKQTGEGKCGAGWGGGARAPHGSRKQSAHALQVSSVPLSSQSRTPVEGGQLLLILRVGLPTPPKPSLPHYGHTPGVPN